MENVCVDSDGLTAHLDVIEFTTPQYMSLEERVSPVGILTAMVSDGRLGAWLHPQYVMSKPFKVGHFSWFVICVEYTFHDPWHVFVQRNVEFDRLDSGLGTEINATLKEPVKLKTISTYIGKKVVQVEDHFSTQVGANLASTKFLYGLVDLDQRKMVPLPEAVRVKAKQITNPVTPMYVEVKTTGTSGKTREDVVQRSNIDSNKHSNFCFYLEIANKAFQMIMQEPNTLEKFVILCKKETVLGDTLQSSAWNSDIPGRYYCCTTCHDKMVMFCEATFKEYAPKL